MICKAEIGQDLKVHLNKKKRKKYSFLSQQFLSFQAKKIQAIKNILVEENMIQIYHQIINLLQK